MFDLICRNPEFEDCDSSKMNAATLKQAIETYLHSDKPTVGALIAQYQLKTPKEAYDNLLKLVPNLANEAAVRSSYDSHNNRITGWKKNLKRDAPKISEFLSTP